MVDRTVTPGGARLLEQRLSSPSRNLDVIHARLDAVTFSTEASLTASDLREALRKTPDLDRALSRCRWNAAARAIWRPFATG